MVKNLVSWFYSFVYIGYVLGHELDWWQSNIVYQIYPLSFKDSNGDGYGDINGITEKLEYLKELNIGAITLSLMKSPQVDLDSEVSDFNDIDPVLGTLEDFDRMINKSNELGIKVILEFIPNHSSDEHPWFKKSVRREDPYTDYYVWADGRSERTKRAPVTATELEELQDDPLDTSNGTTSSNITTTLAPIVKRTSGNSTIGGMANATLPIVQGANSTSVDKTSTSVNKTSTSVANGMTTVSNQTSSNITTTTSKTSTNSTATNGIKVTGKDSTVTINSTKEGKPPSKKDHTLPPNNWVSKAGGSAWKWNEERQQFYLHQSTANRPDLNYRNPLVVEEIKDVLTFWLDRGVHGFRLGDVPLLFESEDLDDEPESKSFKGLTYPYNVSGYWNRSHIRTIDQPETYDMVVQWRQLLDGYSLNSTDGTTRVLIIDGIITTNDSMLYYGTTRNPGAHLVITCNFICSSRKTKASEIDLLIRWWEDSTPAGHPVAWMTGDQNSGRVGSSFSPERIDVMNILMLLLPGIPFTYYGEEIGMMNNFISLEQTRDIKGFVIPPEDYRYFSSDASRTPFQWNRTKNAGFSTNSTTWLPVHRNYKDVNYEKEKQVSHSHYNVYANVAKLRQLHAVQYGSYKPHVFSDHLFGFSRILEGRNSIVAVFNLGNDQGRIDLLQIKGTVEKMCVFTSTENVNFEDRDNVRVNDIILPSLSSVVFTEKCIKDWATDAAVISNVPSLLLLLVCSLATLQYGII